MRLDDLSYDDRIAVLRARNVDLSRRLDALEKNSQARMAAPSTEMTKAAAQEAFQTKVAEQEAKGLKGTAAFQRACEENPKLYTLARGVVHKAGQ